MFRKKIMFYQSNDRQSDGTPQISASLAAATAPE